MKKTYRTVYFGKIVSGFQIPCPHTYFDKTYFILELSQPVKIVSLQKFFINKILWKKYVLLSHLLVYLQSSRNCISREFFQHKKKLLYKIHAEKLHLTL